MPRQVEHIGLNLDVGDLFEGLLGAADLVIKVQRGGDQPFIMRAQHDGAHPAEEDRLGDGHHLQTTTAAKKAKIVMIQALPLLIAARTVRSWTAPQERKILRLV